MMQKLQEASLIFSADGRSYHTVGTVAEANGLEFQCPVCENGHMLLCFFKGQVPDDWEPGPGRWTPTGTTIADISLLPSIDVTKGKSGCPFHGYVTNGQVG